jgi:hypothetical protein
MFYAKYLKDQRKCAVAKTACKILMKYRSAVAAHLFLFYFSSFYGLIRFSTPLANTFLFGSNLFLTFSVVVVDMSNKTFIPTSKDVVCQFFFSLFLLQFD